MRRPSGRAVREVPWSRVQRTAAQGFGASAGAAWGVHPRSDGCRLCGNPARINGGHRKVVVTPSTAERLERMTLTPVMVPSRVQALSGRAILHQAPGGTALAYDLIIRNGTVVDGSGRPRYRADIGVVGGRIAEIGRIRDSAAAQIDAEGQFVAPGFIDLHTHVDAEMHWDPTGSPSAWHGVTTVVIGNCGFGLAPCRDTDRDLVFRNFEKAEDVPRESLVDGIRSWPWDHYADYLDHLEGLPKGINYGALVGHSALRTYVMGERGFEEEGSDEDLGAMCRELHSAMTAGAMGFSTSRSMHHSTSDGRPVPSRRASWRELEALFEVLSDVDRGMVQFNANGLLGDNEYVNEAERRFADLAVSSGRPVIGGAAVNAETSMSYLDETAARGGHRLHHWMCKPFSSMIGFSVHLPFDTLPGWKEVRSLPLVEQIAIFRSPARRKLLVDEATKNRSGSDVGAEARPPEYDLMQVIEAGVGPYRTVAEISAERNISPVEAIIDLSLASDFQQMFTQNAAPQDGRHSPETFLSMMRHPRYVWGATDAGAHVSQSLEFNIPSYFLGYWVRAKESFTWEEGIRKLSFDAASVLGLRDRGLAWEGNIADLVVFDPETIAPGLPYAENDFPGGALRLKQESVGLSSVIVNGVEVFHEMKPTGAFPGELLRGGPRHPG